MTLWDMVARFVTLITRSKICELELPRETRMFPSLGSIRGFDWSKDYASVRRKSVPSLKQRSYPPHYNAKVNEPRLQYGQ